jgi:3D (Asp-Asp-Asp) domain-containing protein
VRAARRFACAIALAPLVLIGCRGEEAPLRYPPVVAMSPYRLPGAVVRGAATGWWKLASQVVRYGDPMPVGVTMYCLQGTTRRGRYVRSGIVAADPRFFPLSRYIELYVGRTYLGRFLVDDTGKKIRGARIDVWTSSCREARRFGIARGTAVLVQRAPRIVQAGGPRSAK